MISERKFFPLPYMKYIIRHKNKVIAEMFDSSNKDCMKKYEVKDFPGEFLKRNPMIIHTFEKNENVLALFLIGIEFSRGYSTLAFNRGFKRKIGN